MDLREKWELLVNHSFVGLSVLESKRRLVWDFSSKLGVEFAKVGEEVGMGERMKFWGRIWHVVVPTYTQKNYELRTVGVYFILILVVYTLLVNSRSRYSP